MVKTRIVYLDVVRVVACCMIVLMHSPHPEAGLPGMLLSPLSYVTAAGIGLFFMVSGALLLPIKMETLAFLKRRLGKIIGPLLFWTLFYLIANVIYGKMSLQELAEALITIPFSAQGHGVLWFMYTLAGLYLLAPIISAFLVRASRKEIWFYILLWIVALCYPLLSLFLDVNRTTTGVLYYFMGYAGYFVLGYYMHVYKTWINPIFIFALVVLPLLFFFFHRYYSLNGDFFDVFGYLSITVMMLCVVVFYGIRRAVESLQLGEINLLTQVSNACFGIYLMHIFVMRYVLWNCDFIVCSFGGIGQLVITWLLTLFFSFVITWAWSFMPYSEYMIGYTNYRKTKI